MLSCLWDDAYKKGIKFIVNNMPDTIEPLIKGIKFIINNIPAVIEPLINKFIVNMFDAIEPFIKRY